MINTLALAQKKERQTFLKNKGWYTKNVDGDWGQFSRDATKKFQSWAKTQGYYCSTCAVDGVWGNETEKAYKRAITPVTTTTTTNITQTLSNISGTTKFIPKTTFLDMKKRVENWVKTNGSAPSTVYIDGTKREYVTYARYKNMLERMERWKTAKGTYADGVYVNPPTAPVPPASTSSQTCMYVAKYLKDYIHQETNYWCGPNCLQQVIYELWGKYYSEKEIANIAGTTTSGTGHSGLDKALTTLVHKFGGKLKIEWKNFSSVKWEGLNNIIKNPKKSFFTHCLYKNNPNWGHYEYFTGICLNKKQVIVANSLSGGWIETRSFATAEQYMRGISQPSICIVTKL